MLESIKQNSLTLSCDQTIAEAAIVLMENKADSAAVLEENGNWMGIITSKHITKALKEHIVMSNKLKDLIKGRKLLHTKNKPNLRAADIVQPYDINPDKLAELITRENWDTSLDYDAIINSIHNLIIAVDKQGTIKLYNKSAEQLLGFKVTDAIGKNILEIIPNSRLLNVIESGQAETLQKIRISDSYCAISNRTPIIRDGEVIGAVGVFQDISEIERFSRELQYVKKLNEDLDAIVESSFDGLFITDGDGTILRYNKAFVQLTGINAQEYMGRNVEDIKKDGIMSELVSLKVMQQRKPVTIMQKSRSGKITLTTGNPVFNDDGEIIRVVINVRDTTELESLRRDLEKQHNLSRHYETELKSLRLRYTGDGNLVISSAKMIKLMDTVVRLASVDSTVLITGESGTGKELIAETIHNNSARKDKPFIKVNCGAIPENLLESELFGYDHGAFTGASKEGKPGYVELAAGGTIFLDEIGEVPLNLQVKLLRFLQNKEIIRVGGKHYINVDVRIVAATNRDLKDMVLNKKFREDLYYRLNVVPINVPPLRERKDDIPPMVAHFLQLFNRKYNMNKVVSPEVVNLLMEYDWPGNVRELENLIERMIVITPHDIITRQDLPCYVNEQTENNSYVSVTGIIPLREAIESVEKQLLEKVYSKGLTTRQMAKELKVNASTVVRKAAKYKIVQTEAN